MKRVLLTLTIILVIGNLSFSQITDEAITLTNSLSELWSNGETEKAIESSVELYRLYPPLLIMRIHNSLAQQIQKDSKLYGQKYLEQLSLKKNEGINKIIFPIYLWSRTLSATTANDLKNLTEELNHLLTDSANYESETERYCLLILQDLDKKNAIDDRSKEKILQKNIKNLEAYPYITKVAIGRKEREKRAWHRYLLAFSYNYLYTLKPIEEYLKKASDYSPDITDRQHSSAYFYDAALLTGNIREFGFQNKYQKYLVDNNRNSEALDLLSSIAFGNPSDSNIKTLHEFCERLNNKTPFNDYWKNYVHNMGKSVPRVKIQFEKEELDLTNIPDKWIYIDVWGTWCNPCREELPELQSFYIENINNSNSNLKIYTFSFNSQKLADFMNDNKYTFPVSEIDKQTNDLFEVTGYPTKILISPDGHYIKIPYGVDWKMFIKNYTLM